MKKYIPSIVAVVTVAVAFLVSYNANAQSCKTEKTVCVKSEAQTLGAINAEILSLERELANIEKVARQNNINLGTPYNYMILNKTANVAVLEEKETAKK